MTTWLRSALFNAFFFGFSATYATLILPATLLPRRMLLVPIRFWAGIVVGALRVICGVRTEVTGREHLPREGAALIAAKHQSAYDTIVWLWLLPDPAYVVKRELFSLPVWGWLMRASGQIAVDRLAGASAMRHLMRTGQRAAAEGRQMVIFPEGTRVNPGEYRPYQPGIAALAAATGLPVIPVATDSGLRWGRRAFHKQPGVIHIHILPPLPADLRREALVRRLEDTIEGAMKRLPTSSEPVDKSVD
jgi:1-acyl-sn-glycerol-3-phosphate acyltransferase